MKSTKRALRKNGRSAKSTAENVDLEGLNIVSCLLWMGLETIGYALHLTDDFSQTIDVGGDLRNIYPDPAGSNHARTTLADFFWLVNTEVEQRLPRFRNLLARAFLENSKLALPFKNSAATNVHDCVAGLLNHVACWGLVNRRYTSPHESQIVDFNGELAKTLKPADISAAQRALELEWSAAYLVAGVEPSVCKLSEVAARPLNELLYPATPVPKEVQVRAHGPGEVSEKIRAALVLHHNFNGQSDLNTEPISVTELAKLAQVKKPRVSEFFTRKFIRGDVCGYKFYKAICRYPSELEVALANLDGTAKAFIVSADEKSSRRIQRERRRED